MDLTPQKPSEPWWYAFGCCRPSSSLSEVVYQYQEYESISREGSATDLSSASGNALSSRGEVVEKTTTTAEAATDCTGSSVGGSEVGNEYMRNDDEVAVSTPKRKNSSSSALCEEDYPKELQAEENNFLGEVSVSIPRQDDTECPARQRIMTSSPQENGDGNDEEEDDIPDIDFPLMKPPTPARKKSSKKVEADAYTPNESQEQDGQQVETKFYQFMLVMMVRHIFGYWLQGEYDPATNIFNPTTKLLLAQAPNSEKKEYGRMMKLRKLSVKEGNKCEVVPQLKSEY